MNNESLPGTVYDKEVSIKFFLVAFIILGTQDAYAMQPASTNSAPPPTENIPHRPQAHVQDEGYLSGDDTNDDEGYGSD